MSKRLRGLYLITPQLPGTEQDDEEYLQRVADALSGGAVILQFRDKSRDQLRRKRCATELLKLCQAKNVVFIVNDDIELAAEVGAHGVHLGEHDRGIAMARKQLGDEAIIGVSCYNRLSLAQSAELQGANYVAFGRFFPSRSKPQAVQAPLSLISMAKQSLRVPIVAIGGITLENAEQLIGVGADMLAVIEGVFGQQDRQGAARSIVNCFSPDANELISE